MNIPGFNQKTLEQRLDRLATAFERLATAQEEQNRLLRAQLDDDAPIPYLPHYSPDH